MVLRFETKLVISRAAQKGQLSGGCAQLQEWRRARHAFALVQRQCASDTGVVHPVAPVIPLQIGLAADHCRHVAIGAALGHCVCCAHSARGSVNADYARRNGVVDGARQSIRRQPQLADSELRACSGTHLILTAALTGALPEIIGVCLTSVDLQKGIRKASGILGVVLHAVGYKLERYSVPVPRPDCVDVRVACVAVRTVAGIVESVGVYDVAPPPFHSAGAKLESRESVAA